MKKLIVSAFVLFSLQFCLSAQNTQEVESVERDIAVDSTLVGLSVSEAMPGCVRISHSPQVEEVLTSQINSNSSRLFNGYRIRIFFNSARDAREKSAQTMDRFCRMYPDISAYRSYSSPNFKVTVGNFRTRLEAEDFLSRIRTDFPGAFVVREKFKYPSLEKAKVLPDDIQSR